MAFDIVNDQLINERIFFDATAMKRPGLADGMKVNTAGFVFATGPGGVLIFLLKENTWAQFLPKNAPQTVLLTKTSRCCT